MAVLQIVQAFDRTPVRTSECTDAQSRQRHPDPPGPSHRAGTSGRKARPWQSRPPSPPPAPRGPRPVPCARVQPLRPAARRSAGQTGGLRLTRRGRVAARRPEHAVPAPGGPVLRPAHRRRRHLDVRPGPATGVVVVQAGESLWQIAQAIAPQADPRETVTLIRELNGLGERRGHAGSVDRRAGHRGTGRLTRGPSARRPPRPAHTGPMPVGTRLGGGLRAPDQRWSPGRGVLALAVSVPIDAVPLMPVPDPAVPSSSVPPAPTAPAPVVTPDRVDRQWPKNPPWDACPRPVWPGERSAGMPGGGRRVLVIGDSLTRESRDPHAEGHAPRRLDAHLPLLGVTAARLGDRPGAAIPPSSASCPSTSSSPSAPTTSRGRPRRPPSAGSAPCSTGWGPNRTVLWVDLHLTRSAWLDARAAWFNDLLRRLEKQRPNLTVVDWHEVARAQRHPRLGRHPLRALRLPPARPDGAGRPRCRGASGPGERPAARGPRAQPGARGPGRRSRSRIRNRPRCRGLGAGVAGAVQRVRDDSPGIRPCQAALHGLLCYP